jgi:hypothetical protein
MEGAVDMDGLVALQAAQALPGHCLGEASPQGLLVQGAIRAGSC